LPFMLEDSFESTPFSGFIYTPVTITFEHTPWLCTARTPSSMVSI